jgi:hypothetical protein
MRQRPYSGTAARSSARDLRILENHPARRQPCPPIGAYGRGSNLVTSRRFSTELLRKQVEARAEEILRHPYFEALATRARREAALSSDFAR